MTGVEAGPELRFRRNPDGVKGAYRVLLDGVDIGEVRKWTQSYNLRRVIVARGWKAFDVTGEKVGRPGSESGAWDTRQAAGMVLALKAMQR